MAIPTTKIALKSYPTRYLVVDVETTGLKNAEKVVEIGLALVDNEEGADEACEHIKMFSTLVNSTASISDEAFAVHHISVEQLACAPKPAEAIVLLHDWLQENHAQDTLVVAHNAPFDLRMLDSNGYLSLFLDGEEAVRHADSIDLAKLAWPKSKTGHSLAALCERLGIRHDYSHRALGDCASTVVVAEMAFEALAWKDRSAPESFDAFKRVVVERMRATLEDRIPDPVAFFKSNEDEEDPLRYVLGPHSDAGRLVQAYRETVSVSATDAHERLMRSCQGKDVCALANRDIRKFIEPHGRSHQAFTEDLALAWKPVAAQGLLPQMLGCDFQDMSSLLDVCLGAADDCKGTLLVLAEMLYASAPGLYPFVPVNAACGLSSWLQRVDPAFPLDMQAKHAWNGGIYLAFAIACKWLFDRMNCYRADLKTFGQLESLLENIGRNHSPYTDEVMQGLAEGFKASEAYVDFCSEYNKGRLAIDLRTRRDHGFLQTALAELGRYHGYFAETEVPLCDGEGTQLCRLDALWTKADQLGHLQERVAFEVQVSGEIKGAMANLNLAAAHWGPACRGIFVGSAKDIESAKRFDKGGHLEYWEYGRFSLAVRHFFFAMKEFSAFSFADNDDFLATGLDPFIEHTFINSELYDQVSFATYEVPGNTAASRKGGNRPSCPACQSPKTLKDGRQRGKQRYVCKSCGRKFS